MARNNWLLLTLALSLSAATTAWAVLPLDLLTTGGIPSPTDVVKVIDALTKKDSETTVAVTAAGKGTISQGKLLVARTRVEVALSRSSRNWRGRVLVNTKVPSDITYSVDLTTIKAEHVRCDAEKKLLTITMPPLQVEDVTPLLAEAQTDRTFQRARFRFCDSNAAREVELALLREDYQARARKFGEERLATVREQGRATLENFLQALFHATAPDVRVVVE
jgi:hypothetical protein